MKTETQLTPMQALQHLRAFAAGGVPNCVNLDYIDHVLARLPSTSVSRDYEAEISDLNAQIGEAHRNTAAWIEECGKRTEARKEAEAKTEALQAQIKLLSTYSYVPLISVPAVHLHPFQQYLEQHAPEEYKHLTMRQAAPGRYWHSYLAATSAPVPAGVQAAWDAAGQEGGKRE